MSDTREGASAREDGSVTAREMAHAHLSMCVGEHTQACDMLTVEFGRLFREVAELRGALERARAEADGAIRFMVFHGALAADPFTREVLARLQSIERALFGSPTQEVAPACKFCRGTRKIARFVRGVVDAQITCPWCEHSVRAAHCKAWCGMGCDDVSGRNYPSYEADSDGGLVYYCSEDCRAAGKPLRPVEPTREPTTAGDKY